MESYEHSDATRNVRPSATARFSTEPYQAERSITRIILSGREFRKTGQDCPKIRGPCSEGVPRTTAISDISQKDERPDRAELKIQTNRRKIAGDRQATARRRRGARRAFAMLQSAAPAQTVVEVPHLTAPSHHPAVLRSRFRPIQVTPGDSSEFHAQETSIGQCCLGSNRRPDARGNSRPFHESGSKSN